MDNFLERSFKGMADREELNLMKRNFGKIKEHQQTVHDVVNPNFAYQHKAPATRISKLNPMLDGSSKLK